MAVLPAPMTIQPVAYTHLDVYKRQRVRNLTDEVYARFVQSTPLYRCV